MQPRLAWDSSDLPASASRGFTGKHRHTQSRAFVNCVTCGSSGQAVLGKIVLNEFEWNPGHRRGDTKPQEGCFTLLQLLNNIKHSSLTDDLKLGTPAHLVQPEFLPSELIFQGTVNRI